MNNYLIDSIRNERNWGISSDKKVPLYLGTFLLSGNPQDIRAVRKEDMNNLPTLSEIDNCHFTGVYNFNDTNRAYHMQAGQNLVVGFDVENFEGDEFDKLKFSAPHRTDPSFLEWFSKIPAHYREYSNHYGIHLLYQLKRKRLTDKAIDMLSERTEYKYKGEYNGKKLEYELMMNNHWLTLTRNVFGNVVDLSHDAPDFVYNLLNNIAQDYQNKQNYLAGVDIKEQASPLAQKMARILFNDKVIERNKNLSVEDFNDDNSNYEAHVALSLASSLKYRLENPKPFDVINLKTSPALITISDKIWATAIEMKEIIPPRAKHNAERNGLPWLVYVAQRAWNYIISEDFEERNE